MLQRGIGDAARSAGNGAVSVLRVSDLERGARDRRNVCEPNEGREECSGKWTMHIGYWAGDEVYRDGVMCR